MPSATTPLSALHLGPGNLDECVALSRSVGWNDSPADWRVLFACARGFGLREPGGRLVAQCLLCDLGPLACVAKMVVHASHRGEGLGRRLLAEALAAAREQGFAQVALFATELGRPLYERTGFARVADVHVLGATDPPARSVRAASPMGPEHLDEVVAFDRRALGCDRGAMLRARFAECDLAALVRGPGGGLAGYAMRVPQGDVRLLGPVVADDESAARALIARCCERAGGPLRIDVPDAQRGLLAWLTECGFAPAGSRAEMSLGGAPLPWATPARFALAAQGYG